jgi:hypothetical protein
MPTPCQFVFQGTDRTICGDSPCRPSVTALERPAARDQGLGPVPPLRLDHDDGMGILFQVKKPTTSWFLAILDGISG